MKILRLEAENLKRLKAVSIRPDGNLVEITGKNGQGKTSILDAIYWCLAGTKPIQNDPIRHGADSARAELDLGDLIVTRRFYRKEGKDFTTNLVVESKDGGRYKSPQAILDALVDSLTFDPMSFIRMKPREQFDALKRFVPDFDFEENDNLNRADFEKRTDANREAKRLRSACEAIVIPEDFEPVDEDALIEEMTEAAAANEELAARKRRREATAKEATEARRMAADCKGRAAALEEQAQELLAQARKLVAKAEQAEAEAQDLDAKLAAAPSLPDPIDVTDLARRLNKARAHNAAGARASEKCRLSDEAHAKELEAKRLTDQMDARDIAKQMAIERAALPVKGLSFGAGEILLNGVPFDQASDAEKLRASVAIAMAGDSKLRVIRVRDGSLLDPDSMALLGELADEHDCQVWVETVASGRPAAVVIEDGAVKES